MTDADLAAGVAALVAYEGWEDGLVGDQANTAGATEIIKVLDSSGPAPTPDAQAIVAATAASALMTSLTNAGYGSDVTSEQCLEAAQAVIAAVQAERGTV